MKSHVCASLRKDVSVLLKKRVKASCIARNYSSEFVPAPVGDLVEKEYRKITDSNFNAEYRYKYE